MLTVPQLGCSWVCTYRRGVRAGGGREFDVSSIDRVLTSRAPPPPCHCSGRVAEPTVRSRLCPGRLHITYRECHFELGCWAFVPLPLGGFITFLSLWKLFILSFFDILLAWSVVVFYVIPLKIRSLIFNFKFYEYLRFFGIYN